MEPNRLLVEIESQCPRMSGANSKKKSTMCKHLVDFAIGAFIGPLATTPCGKVQGLESHVNLLSWGAGPPRKACSSHHAFIRRFGIVAFCIAFFKCSRLQRNIRKPERSEPRGVWGAGPPGEMVAFVSRS